VPRNLNCVSLPAPTSAVTCWLPDCRRVEGGLHIEERLRKMSAVRVVAFAPSRSPRARSSMLMAIQTGFTRGGPKTRTPGEVHTHPLMPIWT